MADFSHYSTKKSLQEEVFKRIKTKASNLSREELIRLLNILTWDFGLIGDDETENLRATDNQTRLKEILTIADGQVLPIPTQIEREKWSDDVKRLPLVNYADIFSYLILSPSETFNTRTLRNYSSLESYRLVECDDVAKIQSFNDPETMGDLTFVKCIVRASQTNGQLYYPWILLDSKNNQIRGGQCTCVAGLGESCSHVGALLFLLEKITALGINKELTVTDKLCGWKIPTIAENTVVTPISHFEAVQRVHRRRPPAPFDVSLKDENELGEFLKIYAPTSRLVSDIPSGVDAMDQDEDDILSTVSHMESVTATIELPNVSVLVKEYLKTQSGGNVQLSDVFQLIKNAVDDDISRAIEECTREQSYSTIWLKMRLGRITASEAANRVYKYYEKSIANRRPPESLINQVVNGGSDYRNEAMEWGTNNESVARDAFINSMKERHPQMIVDEVGFKVSPACGHFGASADGLVRCTCESCPDLAVLEIKAPFSVRSEDVSNLNIARKLDYLDVDDDGVARLKKHHKYFTQVQLEMAVWKIDYDREYCERLLQRIDDFYSNFIVPHLIDNALNM